MMIIAALLLLASVAYIVAGLIVPGRVVPGRKKSRMHAIRLGSGGVLVGFLIAALAPDPDATAKAAICEYFERDNTLINEYGRQFGRLPSEALLPGDIVFIEGTAVIGPALGSDGTVDGALAAIATLVRIPDGDSIEVLERVTDRHGKLYYRARWEDENAVGYINPGSMTWLDSRDALVAHYEKRDAWMKPKLATLRRELFDTQGLKFETAFRKSLDENWKCGE